MILDVLQGLFILASLVEFAAIVWMVFAVGLPLRQWLLRELDSDPITQERLRRARSQLAEPTDVQRGPSQG